jgi:hypothetical protein
MNKYLEKYYNIIVEIEHNSDDIDYIVDYFYDVIKVKNITNSVRYKQMLYNNRTKSYIRYNGNSHHITYGKIRNLNSNGLYNDLYEPDYEKVFTINDVRSGLIKNLIINGIHIPNYKPKKIIREL